MPQPMGAEPLRQRQIAADLGQSRLVGGRGNRSTACALDQVGMVLAGPTLQLGHCRQSGVLEGVETRGLSRCTVEAYAHDLALVHRWLFASGQKLAELPLRRF